MQLAKDPTGLTRFVVVMMWITLLLAAVAVVIGAVFLSRGVPAQAAEGFTTKDAITGGIGLLQVLVLVATCIPFCMWVHRANRNAHALGAKGMQFTPGWAVGWYFIPIANLWKPYQAMKEIWQASHNPRTWGTEPAGLVSNWWTLWLLTNFLGNWSFRMSMRAETPQALFNSELVSLFSDVTDIALCLVAIRMLSTICRKQLEWARAT